MKGGRGWRNNQKYKIRERIIYMNNGARDPYNSDESVSLLSILETIWEHKAKIAITSSVAVFLAIIYLFVAAPKYTATMILAAVQEQGSSSTLGALGQFSAISGIKIGESDAGQRFSAFIDLLTSHVVAKRLMKDEQLIQKIFSKEWDQNNNKWHPHSGIISFLKRAPGALFGRPTWSPPTPTRLAKYLSDNINVRDFGDAGMKTISIDHKDPVFAVELLDKVYKAADNELKADALIRTKQYIAYLERRLSAVSLAEHRQALSHLLIDQERAQMIIEAELPYSARVVSDAISSDLPTEPKVVVTLIIALLIGVFIGVLWIFLLQKETAASGERI